MMSASGSVFLSHRASIFRLWFFHLQATPVMIRGFTVISLPPPSESISGTAAGGARSQGTLLNPSRSHPPAGTPIQSLVTYNTFGQTP
uniref:Uncharacterized protein n=1 Tax=Arundo donax TaxID=35708 RepID=A0A0A9EMR2_ARUDO